MSEKVCVLSLPDGTVYELTVEQGRRAVAAALSSQEYATLAAEVERLANRAIEAENDRDRFIEGKVLAEARAEKAEAEVERLTRERDEARADHEWMRENRNKWQDAATIARRAEASAAVEVKALEWTKDNTIGGHGGWLGRCGDFTRAVKMGWMIEKPYEFGDQAFASLDAAKAAAQADYERRILSALTTEPAAPRSCTCHPDDNPPVPCAEKYAYSECAAAPQEAEAQAIRDKALEEAATLADLAQAQREQLYSENGASINAHKAVQAEEIAAAIRAMKGGKP